MKIFGISSTAVFVLMLGTAVFASAQQEQHRENTGHPAQTEHQQPRAQQAQQKRPTGPGPNTARQPQAQRDQRPSRPPQKPSPQQQAQQSQQAHRDRQPVRHDQPQRPPQRAQRANQSHGQQFQRPAQQATWQQHRARNWQSDHRTWQQRGGYNGYRIPNDRYRGYFGPEHGFRIRSLPFMVVGGYPRFQYQGYWISAMDPWPESWANDWYDTDDVYVNYVDNGYYLYNRSHPNVGIAISISM